MQAVHLDFMFNILGKTLIRLNWSLRNCFTLSISEWSRDSMCDKLRKDLMEDTNRCMA